jgi:hypothetical protein
MITPLVQLDMHYDDLYYVCRILEGTMYLSTMVREMMMMIIRRKKTQRSTIKINGYGIVPYLSLIEGW